MNALQKISSIIDLGLLSGQELDSQSSDGSQSRLRSFDETSRSSVSLNVITQKATGVSNSLFHPAKGGLSVAVEEAVHENGILQTALTKNEEQIKASEENFALKFPSLRSYAKATAIQEILSEDDEFHKEVAAKILHTALIILKDMEAQGDEVSSKNGCRETFRETVSSEKIHRILISSQFKKLFLDVNEIVTFIPDDTKTIIFPYKDDDGHPQQITLKNILCPDYENALEDYVANRNLMDLPLFTHMTRLPISPEILKNLEANQ
ncbi:MAG: hypothetical protein ChlgKO_11110 [Chlamydiales bacterium]